MNHIWNVLLAAEEQGLPKDGIWFVPAGLINPYMETSFFVLNQEDIYREPIEINPWYRFGGIFQYLLDGKIDLDDEVVSLLFDLLIHFLAEIDLHEGLCKNEYYGMFLRADIEKSVMGAQLKDGLTLFAFKQRRFITDHLVRLYKLGPSLTLLEDLLRQIYPHSMIYLDTDKKRELLVYVGQSKTKELEAQIEFLLSLFVPFDYMVHLFWEMHFGIIGVDETVDIGEFEIY